MDGMKRWTSPETKQAIELGDEVRVRANGRVGIVTGKTWERVWVRFPGAAKAAYLNRSDVDSVKFFTALAEVAEDEEHERAYDRWAAEQFAR